MSKDKQRKKTILKVLSGLQSGVEVDLTNGDYTIGSGPDDDIQLIDVSLEASHAKLRVAYGSVSICALNGTIVTSEGTKSADGSDAWQELDPLEIVTAGTMRFATGPINAQWSTLADLPNTETDTNEVNDKEVDGKPSYMMSWYSTVIQYLPSGARQIIAPIFLVVFAILLVGGILPYLGSFHTKEQKNDKEQFQIVRRTLDQFSFGKDIQLTQEVDGELFATGYVETMPERRAIIKGVDRTNIPVKFRIAILESLRREIAAVIKEEKLSVTFDLSSDGKLSLYGLVLDDKKASQFFERIQTLVPGLREIKPHIRTARIILKEVKDLTTKFNIAKYVILRLDGTIIEANGVLPNKKIDSWVDFLRLYARKFGSDIAMRSFVQLQNIIHENLPDPSKYASNDPQGKQRISDSEGDHKTSKRVIVIGNPASNMTAARMGASPLAVTSLDVDGLKQGLYTEKDVFVNLPANAKIGGGKPAEKSPNDQHRNLMWAEKYSESQGKLFRSLPHNNLHYYMHILDKDEAEWSSVDPCTTLQRVTVKNIKIILFWLDMLSLTTSLSLADFHIDKTWPILETALNPTLSAMCLQHSNASSSPAFLSHYLREIQRNPTFIRFIMRGVLNYPLDITGVHISKDQRYVQLRNGNKLRQGSLYKNIAKLAIIGELGTGMVVQKDVRVSLYGDKLNWLVE